MTAKVPIPPHPFYPQEINLAGYIANEWSMTKLLTVFFGSVSLYLLSTFVAVRTFNPRLRSKEQLLVMWFVLTGTIHFFFEGYFAVNHYRMPAQQDLFGQLWKEYARSDSRYLTSDPFVLCMESITALLWGPLSFLAAWMILTESPYRHPIQSLVSIGQIYGDTLYYATNTFDIYYRGVSYSRPEWVYFWFYYVIINSFWIIIPGFCLYQSMKATAAAFRVAQRSRAANGSAKKRL